MAEHYDAVVIGAGQSGVPLAQALAEAGWRTVIVERNLIGGTCINVGCTPTKTMIASAQVAYTTRRAQEYGVQLGPVEVDFARVRQRKRDIVMQFRESAQESLEKAKGLDIVFGEATFTRQKTLEIRRNSEQPRRIEADHIFIDTGARPTDLPIEGIDTVHVLHEDTLMELDALPEHLVILGGNYLGLEFGQMFRRFGSHVTIIEKGERLAAKEDEDISSAIADILTGEGVEILLQSEAQRVETSADGRFRLRIRQGEGTKFIEGSHLMVAVGRTPNTDALNLSAAGIQIDKHGHICVNDRLETNIPGVYAMGDVKGGPAFTHISYDDFRIIRANLLEKGNRTIQDRPVPYVMFIDPQLGRVGMTEEQAREKGLKVKVAVLPMEKAARAIETGETRGLMKAVVDADSGQILGCAILGREGGEVMAVLQMAMLGKVPYTAVRDGVFAHPTLTESLNNLFMNMK